MKIALIGSAPSSVSLAPYSDTSWLIWGCSPGVYPIAGRINAWFELHRWEPPVIGKAALQKPWFSPEYVQWMGMQQLVWMHAAVPEIPNSQPFPWQVLVRKYGHYFFTSSIAWMLATAIETILQGRRLREKAISGEIQCPPGVDLKALAEEQDVIGLWGVDMAATEEYGYQRAGCQFFLSLADKMGIEYVLPFESDLMVPAPLYGICEGEHRHIKMLKRREEFMSRMQAAQAALQQAQTDYAYLRGALEDNNYHLNTWVHQGDAVGTDFLDMFVGQNEPVKYPLVNADVPASIQTGEERLYGGAAGPGMMGGEDRRTSMQPLTASWKDRNPERNAPNSEVRVGDQPR